MYSTLQYYFVTLFGHFSVPLRNIAYFFWHIKYSLTQICAANSNEKNNENL
jgi:hypothetical protein